MFRNYKVHLQSPSKDQFRLGTISSAPQSTQISLKGPIPTSRRELFRIVRQDSDSLFDIPDPQEAQGYIPQHNQSNRHFNCDKSKRAHYASADLVDIENQLIDPVLIRNSKDLKSKPALSKLEKKRIINCFTGIRKSFFRTTPMDVEYELLRQKQLQRERDKDLQQGYFGYPVQASYFSKALVRGWNQITSALSTQDHFNINLSDSDINSILKKQPKLLHGIIDKKQMGQNLNINDEIGFQRRKQLVESVFADKHLNVKDREVIYSVMTHQIGTTIKQQERIERVGFGLKFNKKQNSNAQQLKRLEEFIKQNYALLVKRL